MFERPQKAQVVRIKIEAISLDSTSIAPSLDGPLLANLGRTRATTIWRWLSDPVSATTHLRSSGRIQFFALGSSSVVVARQNQHSGLSTSNLVRRGTSHVIGVRTIFH